MKDRLAEVFNISNYRDEAELTADDVIDETSGVKDMQGEIEWLTMKDVIDYVEEPFYVPENLLINLRELQNSYYELRHGLSKANKRGIIVSDPDIAKMGFGLTDDGKDQIETVAGNSPDLDEDTIIISSDLLRTVETALIFRKVKGIEKIGISEALRERRFGDLEMQSVDLYTQVWKADRKDYAHKMHNVESVAEVLFRTTMLIKRLERRYKRKKIVLISHGDVLQILETGFRKMNPSLHRKLKHLENGELRELWLNPLLQAV